MFTNNKFIQIVWLWLQCFKSMQRTITLLPFIIYAMVQFFFLMSLVFFIYEPFASVYMPLIKGLFGERAFHYPDFFYVLTPFFNQGNIILSGILGVLVIGISTHLFALTFRDEKPSCSRAVKISLSRYGALLFIWFMETLLALALIVGLPGLIIKILQPQYNIERLFEFLGILLGTLVTSIFAFTSALIILDNQKISDAIYRAFFLFKNNAIMTFVLVAVPALLHFPISYLTKKNDLLVTKFSPEMIVFILGLGILISFFAGYFQIGALTRFYLQLKENKY